MHGYASQVELVVKKLPANAQGPTESAVAATATEYTEKEKISELE